MSRKKKEYNGFFISVDICQGEECRLFSFYVYTKNKDDVKPVLAERIKANKFYQELKSKGDVKISIVSILKA